jgi:hypothetical protein
MKLSEAILVAHGGIGSFFQQPHLTPFTLLASMAGKKWSFLSRSLIKKSRTEQRSREKEQSKGAEHQSRAT